MKLSAALKSRAFYFSAWGMTMASTVALFFHLQSQAVAEGTADQKKASVVSEYDSETRAFFILVLHHADLASAETPAGNAQFRNRIDNLKTSLFLAGGDMSVAYDEFNPAVRLLVHKAARHRRRMRTVQADAIAAARLAQENVFAVTIDPTPTPTPIPPEPTPVPVP